ncbi:uncharacterized protein LOC142633266 [Castanea sativa]|uniref:uncharacterized protein LOC142633266 n=1 Tax=Castanea sativa TaxID=21020 RepID=UPI003F650366
MYAITTDSGIGVVNLKSHPYVTPLEVKSIPNLKGELRLQGTDEQLLLIHAIGNNYEVYELNFLKIKWVIMVLQANSDINLSRPRSKKTKMVDNSNWRPWSELPEALLHQITECILDQRWYKALLPSLVGKVCFGISSGYLIMEDKEKRPDSQMWLMNPFTRHELRFPSPPIQFQYVTLVSLVTPSPPEFIIICFYRQCLQFRRSTDVKWTLYNYDDRNMIVDLAVFNGKIYIISNNADISLLNLNSLQPHLTLLKVKGTADLNYGSWKLLVSDKQLLVICGNTDHEVYELNFLRMELVKIPNLGDQALFQADF